MYPFPDATFGDVVLWLFLAVLGIAGQITIIYAGVTWALRSHDRVRSLAQAQAVNRDTITAAAAKVEAQSVVAGMATPDVRSPHTNAKESELRKLIG